MAPLYLATSPPVKDIGAPQSTDALGWYIQAKLSLCIFHSGFSLSDLLLLD